MRSNAPQPRVRHPFMPTRVYSQQAIPDFSIPPPILPGAPTGTIYNGFPTTAAYTTMPPPTYAQHVNPYQPYNYFRPPPPPPTTQPQQQKPVVISYGQQKTPSFYPHPQQQQHVPVTSSMTASQALPPSSAMTSPTKVNGNLPCYGQTSPPVAPAASSLSPTTPPKNKRNSASLSSSSTSPSASKIVKKTPSTDVQRSRNTSTASLTEDDENDDAKSESGKKTDITPTNQNALSNNNRIFVDGRPYEVRFVQDKAVIERNGLPHQVTFVGKAKDVVIDGVPHKMNFGDEGLQITIDGRPLNIRFGAPSRELYIGQMPLRGSFGGPPIHFALNGVKHRAQLCGPPPEVKIDTEPSYELIRFLRPLPNAAAAPSTTATQPASSVPYGYNSYATQRPQAAPQVFARPALAANARLTAPVAIDQRLLMSVLRTLPRPQGIDLVEQRPCPLSTLTDFNLNLLRIRYKSVINALYSDKSLQCQTCAERFNDEELYTRHMDHHSRVINDQLLGSTLEKMWFSAAQVFKNVMGWSPPVSVLDDFTKHQKSATQYKMVVEDTTMKLEWLLFHNVQESIDEVIKTEIDADEDQNKPEDEEDDKEKIQAGLLLDDQYQNTYCAVCNDKLEQIWDEEDESWKFNNSVTVNDKVYHTFCLGEEQESPRREDDIQASSSDVRIKEEMDQAEAQSSFFNLPGLSDQATSGSPSTIPLLNSTRVDTALLNSVLSAVKNLPPIKKEEPPSAETTQAQTQPLILIDNFDSIMNTLRTLNSRSADVDNFDPNRVKVEIEEESSEREESSIIVKSEPED